MDKSSQMVRIDLQPLRHGSGLICQNTNKVGQDFSKALSSRLFVEDHSYSSQNRSKCLVRNLLFDSYYIFIEENKKPERRKSVPPISFNILDGETLNGLKVLRSFRKTRCMKKGFHYYLVEKIASHCRKIIREVGGFLGVLKSFGFPIGLVHRTGDITFLSERCFIVRQENSGVGSPFSAFKIR